LTAGGCIYRVSLSPFRFYRTLILLYKTRNRFAHSGTHNERRDRRLAIAAAQKGKNLHRESKNKSFCAARFESGASAPKVVRDQKPNGDSSISLLVRGGDNGATIFYANARRTMNKEN
jgi:hypothetical protein